MLVDGQDEENFGIESEIDEEIENETIHEDSIQYDDEENKVFLNQRANIGEANEGFENLSQEEKQLRIKEID